jgi:hypothetical protein
MTTTAAAAWVGMLPRRSAAEADWVPREQPCLPLRRIDESEATGKVAQALKVARRHILTHCTDASRPNAINHGIRALGRDLPIGNGDPYRTVLETFLEETYQGGRLLLEVPVQREGHRHSLLKTLIENQCEFDLPFRLSDHEYTFADYVRSARLLHSFDSRILALDEQSWAILAFTRVMPPEQSRWINLQGRVQDLDRIIEATSEQLQRDTRLVRSVDLRADDLPRNCDVFARACGGLHMLYALAAALSCGYDTPARRVAFGDHMRTHVRRFTYDLRIIDEVEALNRERVGPERAAMRAFDGRVKFLGHSLEVMGIVDQFDLAELSGAERDQVDAGRSQLCDWIIESGDLDLARGGSDELLFDSLVTGICHAYNGLRMSPA